MISISVTSYNGAATSPLSGHFDETGGAIGRGENNQMVLPDPERTISRVHAQVVFRNGRYAIIDRGSNPISVNGRPLGNGQETFIQPGDELQIGGYAMRVEAAAATGGAAADPFADFPGLASTPSAAGRAPAAAPFADPLAGFGAPARSPSAPSARPPAYAPAPAPSAPTGGGIPQDWDPFAPDPATQSPQGHDFARSLGQPAAGGGGNFGLDVGGRAEALIPEFGLGGSGAGGGGGGDSLDALFGLGASSGGRNIDPLAGSALNQAAAQPNMAAHADPMKSLNSMTRGSATAASDTTPELSTPFMVPPMTPAPAQRPPPVAPPRAAPPPVAPVQTIPPTQTFTSGFAGQPGAAGAPMQRSPPAVRAADAAAPPGSVLSWNDPSGESQTVIRPRGGAPASGGGAAIPDMLDLSLDFGAPAPAPVAPPIPAPPPPRPAPPAMAAPIPVPSPPPVAARPQAPPAVRTTAGAPAWQPPPNAAAAPAAAARPAAAAAPSADIAALTAALREGLAVHNLPPDALVLTPAFMRLLGRLVHEATRGTVDLLVARAALKREIRAEVTMIVTRENNPLKFSPSAEVALGHLLSPPARGFMESDKAMRDAYDDLRAHQFGFLAGMRAALEGILKRFDPATLEGKLTQKSLLSSILPGQRKAQMWEVFTQLYSQISSEASDDFHELFGKEFLRAYNEYIDQLAKDRP
ncbi:MAG: type VI secretion system-associated FHA domain protein TagH [Burkholderiales bacterium]|nr:type VI secretion system-associated FHA domain protein TagH [Burkholderiales bacterium]